MLGQTMVLGGQAQPWSPVWQGACYMACNRHGRAQGSCTACRSSEVEKEVPIEEEEAEEAAEGEEKEESDDVEDTGARLPAAAS